jgi:hypothetical protein
MRLGQIIMLTIIFITFNLTLYSQKIEIFGGVNKNIFHDYNKDFHITSLYNSELGYTAGFGIDSIKIDWLTVRFSMQFDKYGGNLEANYHGLGGGNTTVAEIDKWIISLGIFPLNFRLFHKIELNFGLEISRLINETYKGKASGWQIGQDNWSYDLQDKYDQFSSKMYFGIKGRIAYDFNLSQSMIISPQYSYYFGLSNEFQEFPEYIKSMRHYLCIGIIKKIK